VLLSIQGGSNLGIFEINDAAQLVKEAAHPEANIIFGTVIDDTLGDEVRVTVIAAGFDGGEPQARIEPMTAQRPSTTPVVPPSRPTKRARRRRRRGARGGRRVRRPTESYDSVYGDDDLDIPDFLTPPGRDGPGDHAGPDALAARLADLDAHRGCREVGGSSSSGDHPHRRDEVPPGILVERLHALGVRDVGENRQQELPQTHRDAAARRLRWHFIGQLQTKKARAVRAASDVVHSVDRDRVADACTPPIPTAPRSTSSSRSISPTILRGGAAPADARRLAEHVAAHCPRCACAA
jgi:hypothetical protein